jgi:DNA-binding PadR family transcriptional regulator
MASRFGRFESVVAAALARLNEPATSAQILAEILDAGGKALAANVYATLGRLETKEIVSSRSQLMKAPDGKERDVTLYRLTKHGAEELKMAIDRLKMTISTQPRQPKAA